MKLAEKKARRCGSWRFKSQTLIAAALTLVSSLLAQGPDPQSNVKERNNHARWKEVYQSEAKRYEIRTGQNLDKKLTLVQNPILFYSNPAGGNSSHGAFYAWTHQGRAEVIGAIWTYARGQGRHINHEFHSLSTAPVTAAHPDVIPSWELREPGIRLVPIPGASQPAANRALRLAQMRQLSREFVGFQTKDGIERPMRVLESPLFRYELGSNPDDELIDGAVFGIFMDWDPELLLVLEARRGDSKTEWQYAAARFSNKPLRLEHMGAMVWQVPGDTFGGPDQPYYAKLGASVRAEFVD